MQLASPWVLSSREFGVGSVHLGFPVALLCLLNFVPAVGCSLFFMR